MGALPRLTRRCLFIVLTMAGLPPTALALDFDVVYVRCPRAAESVTLPSGNSSIEVANWNGVNDLWMSATNTVWQQPGCDLALRRADGTDEVLVDCDESADGPVCSVVDPNVSFDGRYVVYAKFADTTRFGDAPARAARVRLSETPDATGRYAVGLDLEVRGPPAGAPALITDDASRAAATLVAEGVLNHSGQLFGGAFTPEQRLDPTLPMVIVEEGGARLPAWSGLWVVPVRQRGCSYYAVVATDTEGIPMEGIEPGRNATTEPVAESPAPIRPLKVYDSAERTATNAERRRISGTRGLPLLVGLHASEAQGGGAGSRGDYYAYFGDASMGYRPGMPGVFSVEETRGDDATLVLKTRDAIVAPSGRRALETQWFGYVAEVDGDRFAFPFTEARLLFVIPWVVDQYGVDPDRVYLRGGSMGAWGSVLFGLRRPDLFAAVFPDRPRFRQRTLSSIAGAVTNDDRLPSGELWSDHHDSVRFVRSHPGDLPFLGWNCGRWDGFATWQEQVDMVAALSVMRHGFAFSWNNGDHSSGTTSRREIDRWYPPSLFARDESYPAFSNSSIDDVLGDGSPDDGDPVGGINLGFRWDVLDDTRERWRVELVNELATEEMSVDVTPRRSQGFRPERSEEVSYEVMTVGSAIASGVVRADADGIVTIERVPIRPGATSTLTLTR